MEVIVAEKAGFCFGVKRAVKMAFDASEEAQVHTLGPLIHNPQVVERLAEKGVRQVSELAEVKEGTVILRSHGVSSPQVVADAQAAGLRVIDATCPFVTNAQRYAKQLVDEGYQVVMVGNRNHPETQSVLGHAGGDILVTEDFEEIQKRLNRFPKKRLGIISQTTQTYGTFSQLVVQCLKICEEVKVFNTICYATEDNQTEVQQLARRVQAMVVVGGKNSANTGHLAGLCRDIGVPTYHIETAPEIEPDWFTGMEKVGVAAGASTPDWVIEAVVGRLNNLASSG
jgi:4-hydroxy-3-methylbut-2-enyl diphosphate reductase